MNRLSPADDPLHRRLIVRNVADINRLIIHVFTHWTLPKVEVHFDSLAAVVEQRAQHQIAQISEARHGALSAGLAATTFVVGIAIAWVSPVSLIWTSGQLWQRVLLLAMGALCAGLIGAGIERIWTRLRLMRLLRRLRRQLAMGAGIEEPLRYTGRVSGRSTSRVSITAEKDGVAHDFARTPLSLHRQRPKVLLHNRADFKRLCVHLFTRWQLPIIRISIDGVAPLDVQRAQHHIVRLSGRCNCVLGACLAGVVLLGGGFYVEWSSTHDWDWWAPASLSPLGMVPIAALCAALTGWVIETTWTRVKLMLAVRDVRHRLGA